MTKKLEDFLNSLKGEVAAIIPNVSVGVHDLAERRLPPHRGEVALTVR